MLWTPEMSNHKSAGIGSEASREEWLQLVDDSLLNLADSMTNRMAAAARARGGHARY